VHRNRKPGSGGLSNFSKHYLKKEEGQVFVDLSRGFFFFIYLFCCECCQSIIIYIYSSSMICRKGKPLVEKQECIILYFTNRPYRQHNHKKVLLIVLSQKVS